MNLKYFCNQLGIFSKNRQSKPGHLFLRKMTAEYHCRAAVFGVGCMHHRDYVRESTVVQKKISELQ